MKKMTKAQKIAHVTKIHEAQQKKRATTEIVEKEAAEDEATTIKNLLKLWTKLLCVGSSLTLQTLVSWMRL